MMTKQQEDAATIDGLYAAVKGLGQHVLNQQAEIKVLKEREKGLLEENNREVERRREVERSLHVATVGAQCIARRCAQIALMVPTLPLARRTFRLNDAEEAASRICQEFGVTA